MKSLLALLCLACSLTFSRAAGGVSAKAALRTWSSATSPAVVSRLVYVFGPNGQDQPQSWLFITKDSQGMFQEHKVSGKRFVGMRTVPGFPVGQTISSRRWKTDSTSAFMAADKVARAGKRGFDYVNMEMRCTELSDRPAWFITLVSANHQKVAEVSISAENGAVLKKNFFVPPAQPLPSAEPRPTKQSKQKRAAVPPQPMEQNPTPAPQPGQTLYYDPNRPQSQPQPQQNPVAPPPSRRPGLLDHVPAVRNLLDRITGRGQ